MVHFTNTGSEPKRARIEEENARRRAQGNQDPRVSRRPDAGARCANTCAHGHEVLVETNAGAGIGADDDVYRAAGAKIATTPPRSSPRPT